MKTSILISILFFMQIAYGCVYNSDSSRNNIIKDTLNLSPNNSNQNLRTKSFIANPIDLDYEFYKIAKSEDGTPGNIFVERGKKDYKDGDYVWTKMVPLYASSEFKYVFEYQMDFTDVDMKALIAWLQENIGEKVKGGSIDRPNWYNQEMTLSEVYEYCKKTRQKITMGYFNENLKREAIIIIDTGSITTKTSAEIALVYFIYNR